MQKATIGERARGIFAAVALVMPLALGACAETPQTTFDWNVDTQYRASARTSVPAHHPAQRYAARHARPHRSVAAAARVAPRPRPGWYGAAPQDVTPAQAVGEAHFVWPVEGRVILPFGQTAGGERNDGINIAAQMDEPIRAADSGTVVYADMGPKGYGRLVLIRHDNGYITAYAHADRIAVAKGDHVAQGQIIGYAGETGGVSAPQLHFEIRHEGKPLDPQSLLTVSG